MRFFFLLSLRSITVSRSVWGCELPVPMETRERQAVGGVDAASLSRALRTLRRTWAASLDAGDASPPLSPPLPLLLLSLLSFAAKELVCDEGGDGWECREGVFEAPHAVALVVSGGGHLGHHPSEFLLGDACPIADGLNCVLEQGVLVEVCGVGDKRSQFLVVLAGLLPSFLLHLVAAQTLVLSRIAGLGRLERLDLLHVVGHPRLPSPWHAHTHTHNHSLSLSLSERERERESERERDL